MKQKGFQSRLDKSRGMASQALRVFENTANTLDAAADEQQQVVEDIEAEVVRLTTLRDAAYRNQVANRATASKIKELIAHE